LIAATSWFLLSLAGLGLVAGMILITNHERAELSFSGLGRSGALVLMLGLLVDHGLSLASGNFSLSRYAGWLGVVGLGVLALLWLAGRSRPSHAAGQIVPLVPFTTTLVLVALIAVPICSESLQDWDARSIWFFHAKVIWFDHGVHSSAFWAEPRYVYTHKDYPILVPLLAARFADYFGFLE